MAERSDFRITAYERYATRLVEHLRSLADDVERASKPYEKSGITGTPRHLNAAEQVNHVLTWGIANAGAYRLFDAARHADMAEAEATTAPADQRESVRGDDRG